MHGAGIYRQRYGLDPGLGLSRAAEVQDQVDAFVAEQEAKFGGDLGAHRADYDLLQLYDRFSLYFCLRDVESGEAAELQGYRFEPVAPVARAARPVPVRRAARRGSRCSATSCPKSPRTSASSATSCADPERIEITIESG